MGFCIIGAVRIVSLLEVRFFCFRFSPSISHICATVSYILRRTYSSTKAACTTTTTSNPAHHFTAISNPEHAHCIFPDVPSSNEGLFPSTDTLSIYQL